MPTMSNWTTDTIEIPSDESGLKDNEILVKLLYVSVDPYLRLDLNPNSAIHGGFNVGEPMLSDGIAQVLASKHSQFKKDDLIRGKFKWQQYSVLTEEDLKVPHWSDAANITNHGDIPLEKYLNIFLPVIGCTAYFGILDIGQPKPNEIVLVSAAAGAVGSLVGQIAKIKGCKVIGMVGSDEKCSIIKKEYGFDDAINYKTCGDMRKAIAQVAPNGIDIYYDNVGGETLDAAMLSLRRGGRIIICGEISSYNKKDEIPTGPRLLFKSLFPTVGRIQGHDFLVYKNRFHEALTQLEQWYKEKKIKTIETVRKGDIGRIPETFISLLNGENIGKMIHQVVDEM
jgi:NADPH-dependent curcumin reductase CurA